MSQDSGLVKRGLLLLAGMTVLVVIVLTILFQRPQQNLPAAEARREGIVTALILPGVAYPAALSWGTVADLGQQLPSATGWEIRYNAASALARLGSARIPWALFREMLDEKRQMRNFRARLDDGRDVPDEAKARETVLSALRAVADWHLKQKEAAPAAVSDDRATVYALVTELTASPIVQLKVEAEKTRATFPR